MGTTNEVGRTDCRRRRCGPSVRRKVTIPKGAGLTPDADRRFEAVALSELERLPVSAWSSAIALWTGLDDTHPSTRNRILTRAVELCNTRREAMPDILAAALVSALGASERPRARDETNITTVARFFVRNPRASLRQAGKAIGVDFRTIHDYKYRDEFWDACREEQLLFDMERAPEVHRQYIAKFGETFEYAAEATHGVTLAYVVPLMLEAIADDGPPVTTEMARAQRTAYSDYLTHEALKGRLLAVQQ